MPLWVNPRWELLETEIEDELQRFKDKTHTHIHLHAHMYTNTLQFLFFFNTPQKRKFSGTVVVQYFLSTKSWQCRKKN